MDFTVGEVIVNHRPRIAGVTKYNWKKPHPCGTNRWEILRVGMDFRLKCQGCEHQVMLSRKLVEKNFRGKY